MSMRIDMHAHYVPPAVLQTIERDAASYGVHLEEAAGGGTCACFNYGLTIRPFLPRLLDLDERWEVMARQGVDRQVLSVWADLFGYGMPAAAGTRWHRLLNETLGDTVRQHPHRLSMLASVPLQDAGRAARELEHGVKQCGAVGGVIAANVNDISLGEAPLDDFWAAAVELDVPVFVHPTQPAQPPRTRKYGMLQVVQYTYDTTASVGSLIFGGVLDRFPALRLILSHGGGYFPYQVGRFDRVYRNLETPATPAQPPSAYVRRFYYDTILYQPAPLSYLRDLVGVDRLMLGTDYPFPVFEPEPLQLLERTAWSADDLARVGGETARYLFKLEA
jgi:aminocarboxymuconate-semialdehyde decarboxylase